MPEDGLPCRTRPPASALRHGVVADRTFILLALQAGPVLAGDETAGVTVSVTNRRPMATEALLPGSGAGLVGLRERMRLLGGTLRFGPQADGGWRLESWLPWTPAAAFELEPTQGSPSTA